MIEETKEVDYSMDSGRLNQTDAKLNLATNYKDTGDVKGFSEAIFLEAPKSSNRKKSQTRHLRSSKKYKEDQDIESLATDDNDIKNSYATETKIKESSGTVETIVRQRETDKGLIR
jgi:hypothetical protein